MHPVVSIVVAAPRSCWLRGPAISLTALTGGMVPALAQPTTTETTNEFGIDTTTPVTTTTTETTNEFGIDNDPRDHNNDPGDHNNPSDDNAPSDHGDVAALGDHNNDHAPGDDDNARGEYHHATGTHHQHDPGARRQRVQGRAGAGTPARAHVGGHACGRPAHPREPSPERGLGEAHATVTPRPGPGATLKTRPGDTPNRDHVITVVPVEAGRSTTVEEDLS